MGDPTLNVKKQIPNRSILDYSKSNLNLNTWTHTFHMTQSNRNDDRDTPSPYKQPVFVIYHQNIQGLKGKTNEIIFSLISCAPNIICLTEHHLLNNEIDTTWLPNYKLAANYTRNSLKCGGVCIFIRDNIKFSKVDTLQYCKDQDLEIAAIKLKLEKTKVIVICLYRAPVGNFDYFINQLDDLLHSPKLKFIICGDFNINFSGISSRKSEIEQLLLIYNLIGTVQFHTRINHFSSTTIDNIFVDRSYKYTTEPFINGLSDNDAQLLKVYNQPPTLNSMKSIPIRTMD
jgi:exonuclease III